MAAFLDWVVFGDVGEGEAWGLFFRPTNKAIVNATSPNAVIMRVRLLKNNFRSK